MLYDYSIGKTGGGLTPTAGSLDNTRRLFNFGDRIAELGINQQAFFTYLAKLAKKPTNDSVFKNLEERHLWQRRSGTMAANVSAYLKAGEIPSDTSGTYTAAKAEVLGFTTLYDKFGKLSTTAQSPAFLLDGQLVAFECSAYGVDDDPIVRYRVQILLANVDTTSSSTAATAGTSDSASAGRVVKITNITATDDYGTDVKDEIHVKISASDKFTVVGSAFAQGTGAPDSWHDELSINNGYTQIFKTAIELMTGTTMATEYRGRKNEFLRIWRKKLLEHKDDIARDLLLGVGELGTSTIIQKTWGAVPYIEQYGSIFNMDATSVTYDDFLEVMEFMVDPKRGNTTKNKIVFASTKWIRFLNSLNGTDGFLGVGAGTLAKQLNVKNINGRFGHNLTTIETAFGTFTFVAEPQFRGMYDNIALVADLGNMSYRPLVGNGISRDTFIKTNVQDNDTDGRQDLIITEAGLGIDLAETHAILNLQNFSSNEFLKY